jgi:AcrR family transcriptional regulator
MLETKPLPIPPEADETRQRVLEAAEAVFAEIGYEAATVRMICERAGVKNIGAVNYYFRGKENLYSEVVRNALLCCSEGLPFPEWTPKTPAVQKLRDFIRVLMHRFMRAPRASAMTIMTREFAQPSAACRSAVLQHIQPIAQILNGLLVEILPNASQEKRWLIGFSIVGQCLYYRQNRACAETLMGEAEFRSLEADQLAAHVADFTLAALGFGPPLQDKGKPKKGKP